MPLESQYDDPSPGPSPAPRRTSAGIETARLAALVTAAAGEAPIAGGSARTKLRDAVYALVASLKADGQPPERVLVAVKSAADLEGIAGGSVTRANEVRAAVVRWCVEAYYATD